MNVNRYIKNTIKLFNEFEDNALFKSKLDTAVQIKGVFIIYVKILRKKANNIKPNQYRHSFFSFLISENISYDIKKKNQFKFLISENRFFLNQSSLKFLIARIRIHETCI